MCGGARQGSVAGQFSSEEYYPTGGAEGNGQCGNPCLPAGYLAGASEGTLRRHFQIPGNRPPLAGEPNRVEAYGRLQ